LNRDRYRHSHQHQRTDETIYKIDECISKKIENHIAMIALHYMHYNFVRIHQTLRVTPAMAAGDRLWEIGDIIALLS
jgi:hypothetical protein